MILIYILVTRRRSRSSINSEQTFEDAPVVRKSPSRRKSLNESQSQESSKTVRTRRLSLEETLPLKLQTCSSGVETVKNPKSKSESKGLGRAALVPPPLGIATDTEETLIESTKKAISSKLSKSRAIPVSPLPCIEEEPSPSSVLAQDIVEDLSSDRRVTRSQMDILQKSISGIIADVSVVEGKSNEDSTKTVSKRRTRSASVHISDSEELKPQKIIKSEVKRSSRASSVPPLLSITEEESVETPPKKSKNLMKEHLKKQSTDSSSKRQDCEPGHLDEHENATSSVLPQKPLRRLRSASQSSDQSEKPKSRASAFSSIAEEQAFTRTLEVGPSTTDNDSTTRRITRKQKNKLNKTLDVGQDKSKDEKNADKSSETGELLKPSRRLRSSSQTSEVVDLPNTTLIRKTRASSVPPQMITEDEPNKNQVKSELCVLSKRVSSESETSKISDSFTKKPAKRILRRRSSQNVESSQGEEKNTVNMPRTSSRTKSTSSLISEDLSEFCFFLL